VSPNSAYDILRKFWYDYTNGFFASAIIVLMWSCTVGIGILLGAAVFKEGQILLLSTCPPLLLLGFVFDVIQDKLGIQSPLRRSIAAWAILFPAFKIMDDIIRYILIKPHVAFTEYYVYYSNLDYISMSLLMWGLVGCAFGVGYALAYSRVVEFRISRRKKAEQKKIKAMLEGESKLRPKSK